ncbi:MAG: conserved rane protein of unknown function [Bacillota bacterium]|jgi:hypothetical protein|nr:conserved rane protein of unknown function [Bacillota bacterium]
MNITITFTLFLAVCVGGILLQIFLSKRSKWLGLILPVISLTISLIAVLNIAAYPMTGTLQLADENGIVIQETEIGMSNDTQNMPSLVFTIASVFLLYNIPTIILLAIYFGCRKNQWRRKALEKMKTQDLE